MPDPTVSAVDLFCGCGGLSLGLADAGVDVVGGLDSDPACAWAYETNVGAPFTLADVREVTGGDLAELWPEGSVRMLAACPPCTPFSSHRRGVDTSGEDVHSLAAEVGRLVAEALPDVVALENVPRWSRSTVFRDLVSDLEGMGYAVDVRTVDAVRHGVPQRRRRLLLLASRLGPIAVPEGDGGTAATVRDAIGALPPLKAGELDPRDPLHGALGLLPVNLARIRASRPGGTWMDWPEELRAGCHVRAGGGSYGAVYGRMDFDLPAPTITAQAIRYGSGRFGHPEQHRALSVREAALLQGFPDGMRLAPRDNPLPLSTAARLVGNAVAPPVARALGVAVLEHVRDLAISDIGRDLDALSMLIHGRGWPPARIAVADALIRLATEAGSPTFAAGVRTIAEAAGTDPATASRETRALGAEGVLLRLGADGPNGSTRWRLEAPGPVCATIPGGRRTVALAGLGPADRHLLAAVRELRSAPGITTDELARRIGRSRGATYAQRTRLLALGLARTGEGGRLYPRVPETGTEVKGTGTPPASSPAARSRMRANRRRDTGPEMAVRRALRALGVRGYRVDHPVRLGGRRPIRPDLVFMRPRVAVQVLGCFWHSCPQHGTAPRSNGEWWRAKLERNVERDREQRGALEAHGWTVLEFWEHEDASDVAARIAAEVRGPAAMSEV